MGKTGDDEPRFAFAKLASADNYKKWACKMRFSLESAGLWKHTLSDGENPKLLPIDLKGKELLNDGKLERPEKRADKIKTWSKSNSKCKRYLSRMCLGHIQQGFQAIKTNWEAHDL